MQHICSIGRSERNTDPLNNASAFSLHFAPPSRQPYVQATRCVTKSIQYNWQLSQTRIDSEAAHSAAAALRAIALRAMGISLVVEQYILPTCHADFVYRISTYLDRSIPLNGGCLHDKR